MFWCYSKREIGIGWSRELVSFQTISLKALARSFEYFWALFPSILKSQDFASSTSSVWMQDMDVPPDFSCPWSGQPSPAQDHLSVLGSGLLRSACSAVLTHQGSSPGGVVGDKALSWNLLEVLSLSLPPVSAALQPPPSPKYPYSIRCFKGHTVNEQFRDSEMIIFPLP